MALNLAKVVLGYLKERPDEKLTARQIAEWLFATFPGECETKKLIPIIRDQPAEARLGWMKQFQAVNLAGASQQDAVAAFGRIAEAIKAEKQKGLLILGLNFAGLVAFWK